MRMQSPSKRSRAGTIDQQNHNNFHSKLASTSSEALASCQHEEKNFYEQEIDKFKADLRTLEEAEERVRTSPSCGGHGADEVEEVEEPEPLEASPE